MTPEPQSPSALPAYIAVTAAYWAFMLSDGALRMLVLLHFHTLGFSPLQLAYLFLVYEAMGIVTNASAGWLAARFGLTSTLYAGLSLQIIALLALTQLDASWSQAASVLFVMLVQGLSGVAKDLAKMSSKSAVKLLAPSGDLFRWVAILTGSKNAVKGLGFLLGGLLLGGLGFNAALLAMAGVLALVLITILLTMPPGLPRGKAKVSLREIFSSDANVNWLSAARLFLFGARDVWFVVGIPIFFYDVLSDGSPESARRAFFMIGTFMALWIILYGAVQAAAPKLLGAKGRPLSGLARAASHWAWGLVSVPVILAALAMLTPQAGTGLLIAMVLGLLIFGAIFALNSALHSYLILAFTRSERVTMDVGFYYMANAAGRLIGTLLSGLSYQAMDLPGCLLMAALMAGISALVVSHLRVIDA